MKRVHSKPLTILALGACLAVLPFTSGALAQSKEYQPLGARLGGFLVYPTLEVQGEYNDNIYTLSLIHI